MAKTKARTKPSGKSVTVYFVTLLLSVVCLFGGRKLARRSSFETAPISSPVYQAKVVSADATQSRFYDEDFVDPTDALNGTSYINFNARLLDGDRKGETVNAIQQMENVYSTNRKYVEAGDKVLVMESDNGDGTTAWVWVEYVRTDTLAILVGLFCVALVIFGLFKGFNTLISLIFTCVAIFYVFLPAILAGENAYLWSILTCLYITLMTLLLVNGATKKSFVAGIGCFAGTMASAVMMALMDRMLYMTGVHNDESVYLLMLNTENPINLKGIVFAGVIIGAIGAVMDVSMSVTSPLFEMYEQTGHRMTGPELFKSGIRIGRDFMSTMANTLVLAYIGCDLSLVLLLMAYNTSLIELLNREMIVAEVLQAVIGSFGILLTIPLASFVCAVVLCGPFGGRKPGEKIYDNPEDPPLPRSFRRMNLHNYDLETYMPMPRMDSRD